MRADAGPGAGDRVLVRLRAVQPVDRDRADRAFPVISSTLFGLQSAERGQHELFTLHRANRLVRLWKLQLPAAMPAILTGFQVAATLAVVGSVVGDFFFKQGDAGIGVLIDLYRARLQSEQLFGAALAASLLGVAAFWLFGLIKRVVDRRLVRLLRVRQAGLIPTSPSPAPASRAGPHTPHITRRTMRPRKFVPVAAGSLLLLAAAACTSDASTTDRARRRRRHPARR